MTNEDQEAFIDLFQQKFVGHVAVLEYLFVKATLRKRGDSFAHAIKETVAAAGSKDGDDDLFLLAEVVKDMGIKMHQVQYGLMGEVVRDLFLQRMGKDMGEDVG